MKNTTSKVKIVVGLIIVLITTLALPLTADAATKKKTYCLVGQYDYAYLKEFYGLNLRNAKIIYRNSSKITVKGNWNKGSSLKKAYRAFDNKRFVRINKSYKIAKTCKVVEIGAPKNHTYSWKKWRKMQRCKKNKKIRFIECALVIKNGRVVRIYTGA